MVDDRDGAPPWNAGEYPCWGLRPPPRPGQRRQIVQQPLGWAPDHDDGVRLNIRPFLRAPLRLGLKNAGVLRRKPGVTWNKDPGKEPRFASSKAGKKAHHRMRARELRGRDDFPWFWSCAGGGSDADRTNYRAGRDAEYDGHRWNNLHYTTAAKREARARHQDRYAS